MSRPWEMLRAHVSRPREMLRLTCHGLGRCFGLTYTAFTPSPDTLGTEDRRRRRNRRRGGRHRCHRRRLGSHVEPFLMGRRRAAPRCRELVSCPPSSFQQAAQKLSLRAWKRHPRLQSTRSARPLPSRRRATDRVTSQGSCCFASPESSRCRCQRRCIADGVAPTPRRLRAAT